MEEIAIEKKYTEFIDDLVEQVTPLLPKDVNELQKSYLLTNIRKSAILMASSMPENDEFSKLDFEQQCFYIQILAEWSFHKEIDLFRSGIPPRYWKGVMQKIWYAMWEVMYACVKNDAPETVVLSMVERFVNRTYNDAVDELKASEAIDETIEEQAKEQSNIRKMAEEVRLERKVKEKIKEIIKRFILAIIIGGVVTVTIIKFKTIGLIIILSILLVYHFMPIKKDSE